MAIHIAREGSGWRLTSTLVLPRHRDDVFPFFADPRNLERITPPSLRFEIRTPADRLDEMREGLLIDYRIRLRGMPLRWQTSIDAWEPPFRFVDRQVRGPYRLWRHEHRFEATTDDAGRPAVRCLDDVAYRLPGGPLLAPAAHALLVARDLRTIFAYRATRLLELFPAPPSDPSERPDVMGGPEIAPRERDRGRSAEPPGPSAAASTRADRAAWIASAEMRGPIRLSASPIALARGHAPRCDPEVAGRPDRRRSDGPSGLDPDPAPAA